MKKSILSSKDIAKNSNFDGSKIHRLLKPRLPSWPNLLSLCKKQMMITGNPCRKIEFKCLHNLYSCRFYRVWSAVFVRLAS